VWACGAWLAPLFPGVLSLRITHQDVFYFGTPAAWRTPGVPGWVDYDGAPTASATSTGADEGLPDVDGPPCDPETLERVAVPEHERLARAYLAIASRRSPRRRSSAIGVPVRDHDPTCTSSWPRTPTTTAACGCWAEARATASSTARPLPSASSRG
jgi:hypothetical protein